MFIRNFDMSADEVIRRARRKAIAYMIILAAFTLMCGFITGFLLPPGTRITIGLVASGMMLIVTYSLFNKWCGVVLAYFSESRRHIEDEIASRMVYLNNMTDKPKVNSPMGNSTVQ